MAFGHRIKEARELVGWDQNQLAKESKVAPTTLSILEIRNSDRTKYKEQLIEALPLGKVNLDYVRTGRGSIHPKEPQPEYAGAAVLRGPIAVVGMAKLGDNGYYDEISSVPGVGDGVVDTYSKDVNAYALKVRGDSMTPAIRDGWFVIVEPNSPPVVGEYVLVKLLNGQKMVKELLYLRPDSITVMSVNGETRRTIPIEEIEGIQAVAGTIPPSKWRHE